jgi:predicted transcriptional regulator YdeE
VQAQFTARDAFTAVGFIWDGTYEQADKGEIRELLSLLQQRLPEIADIIEPNHIIGISWNERSDGFRYFVGLRVASGSGTPGGMTKIQMPASEYAAHEHAEGNVFETYRQLFRWLAEHGRAQDKTSLDLMEEYPIDMDPFGPPRLRLMVPVEK